MLPFGLSPSGPAPSFIGDNTDRFSFEALELALKQVWQEVSAPADVAPAAPSVRLEAYPYLDYLTYLGPAVVCLAIFMGSMVSGGLQVLEDRMYGYHEGYLVTPISTGTLVAGPHPRGRDRGVVRGRTRARERRPADAAPRWSARRASRRRRSRSS